MNRKLLALNITLGIGVIYTGIQLRDTWMAAKERQRGMPGADPKAAPVRPVAALPKQPPVTPAGYIDVAQKDLFDPSRNPNLPPPPVTTPPPPPPRNPPPLPSYHGMMDFGDPQGPIALITESSSPRHEEFHAGEKIGEFKLLAFDRKEMTLEWEGKTMHKLLNDGGSEKAAPRPQAGGPEPPPIGLIPGQASEQQPEQPRQQQDLGPGTQMTESVKACQAGDSAAAGTVSGGYRKEVNISPMGPQCLWRAVGK